MPDTLPVVVFIEMLSSVRPDEANCKEKDCEGFLFTVVSRVGREVRGSSLHTNSGRHTSDMTVVNKLYFFDETVNYFKHRDYIAT